MVINLSEETITTTYNALKSVKHDLKMQHKYASSDNKAEIIKHQLAEVEDALAVFEELMDNM